MLSGSRQTRIRRASGSLGENMGCQSVGPCRAWKSLPTSSNQTIPISNDIVCQGSATAPIMLLEDDSDNEEDSDSDDDGGAASRKAGKRRAPSSSSSGGPLYQVHWHRIVLDEAQVGREGGHNKPS